MSDPETKEGRKIKKNVKQVSKLEVKALDNPEVRCNKNDIINALIEWHDKPNMENEVTETTAEGKQVKIKQIFNYQDYQENIRIGLTNLINSGDITESEANDIIAYLSDGEVTKWK